MGLVLLWRLMLGRYVFLLWMSAVICAVSWLMYSWLLRVTVRCQRDNWNCYEWRCCSEIRTTIEQCQAEYDGKIIVWRDPTESQEMEKRSGYLNLRSLLQAFRGWPLEHHLPIGTRYRINSTLSQRNPGVPDKCRYNISPNQINAIVLSNHPFKTPHGRKVFSDHRLA